LLKMQQSDGSVLHKVDTEPNFPWGLSPDADPYTRRTGLASTIDAADFAAVMAQASRVFAPLDAAFAARCLEASSRAFRWVEANPDVGETDVYYTDPDPSQEVTWALGEQVRATHDPSLAQRFAATVQNGPLAEVSWLTPQLLGYVAVALDAHGDAALRGSTVAAIAALGQSLAATAGATGYGVATSSGDYTWESNEAVLHRAAALVFAAVVTRDASFRAVALGQLHYILGDNSLNRSFVTGHGANPVMHPYHWTAYALGKTMPGWCAGGPNAFPSGADLPLRSIIGAGAPPAKCYLDMGNAAGSYASNEGETSENAALVFTTGFFLPGAAPAAQPPPETIAVTGGSGCAAGGDRAAHPAWLAAVLACAWLGRSILARRLPRAGRRASCSRFPTRSAGTPRRCR
jgi:endoglucanase